LIWLAALAPAAAAVAAAAGALRWRYAVVTVHGPSMEPALADGDRLLARRCGLRGLRPGQLVIFREPGLPDRRRPVWLTGAGRDHWVVKRVSAVPGDPVPASVRPAVSGVSVVPPQMVVVLGDAARSRDSRQWGFIPASAILGVGRRLASTPEPAAGTTAER
jgi:signal peptidase I